MPTKTITSSCRPALKRPPLYKVMLFNDDITSFQCVIDILVNHFNKSEDEAYELTFKVHLEGIAIAGTYSKDIAETKVALAKNEIKSSGFPLIIDSFESL